MFLRLRERIQLLLCDAVLPDTSGVLLAQTLRKLSPGLKVIVVSGYPSGGLPETVDTESANELLAKLAKPYDAASLISRIGHASGLLMANDLLHTQFFRVRVGAAARHKFCLLGPWFHVVWWGILFHRHSGKPA
jgi:FixJ family two-component response regulator